MKGFILAAGYGQRMAPVTDVVPKPMLTVGRLPLIGYAISLLKAHGITDIMVNTHHLPTVIEEGLKDGARFGVKLHYSREPEILGTGGGLKRAHQFLDDTFVVVNSDILIEHDLTAAIAEHRAQRAVATMVLRPTDPHQSALAVIETDARNRVVRLYGEGQPAKDAQLPLTKYMFTGLHIIEPKFLEYIPNDVHTSVVQYGYAKALANHELVRASICTGYWRDAGTPRDFLQANWQALEGQLKLSYVDPMAGYKHTPKKDLGHAVRMGEDVHLGAQADLRRPVALDDKCQVAEKAVVGPFAIAGTNAHIGKQAEVQHSVLLPGAQVAAGSRLKNTIVAKGAVLQVEGMADEPEA